MYKSHNSPETTKLSTNNNQLYLPMSVRRQFVVPCQNENYSYLN